MTSEPFFANLTMSAPCDEIEEALGGFDLEHGRPDEVRPRRHRPARGRDDARLRMPEGDGAQPGAVLDVLVAVDIPDVSTAARVDEGRQSGGVLVMSLCVRVSGSRNQTAVAI